MRDVARRSTELLRVRDDADTDVSDHRGDEAGREDVAKVKMDAGYDAVATLPVSYTAVYGRVSEQVNIV